MLIKKISVMKISERRQCLGFGVFNVNLEHISHLFLVFLMLNLNQKMLAGWSVKILLVTHVALSHANLYFEFILRLAARHAAFLQTLRYSQSRVEIIEKGVKYIQI